MVSAENRTGLYVTVPVYFCVLAGASVWAYRRMERMAKEQSADKLSAHYIGGRDFGPLIISGTLFASYFSGYTVVGIPNEAFATGWSALRWMPTFAGVTWGLIGTGFRLRKVSQFRNHQSPADFITDRFQSQLLRYAIVFLQVLTSVIYLAAQVIAIKKTFNGIFGLDQDTIYPVVIILLLILLFECIGGLNSVAFTDSIQGVVMAVACFAIPIIITANFGSWDSLDPETYPRPSLYQTPTTDNQWRFWQFGLINFSFFTLPHFLQRIYAVRNLQSLRIGYTVMVVAPWLCGFVGIFMGTMGVAILVSPEDGSPLVVDDFFTSMMEVLINLGGFAEVCACLGITASLAAIMSTADSLVIAISQLVTVEILYPMMPNAAPAKMAWFGRGASMIAMLLAAIIGLLWDEGLTDLGRIQFPLTTQVIPPFLFGLFGQNKATDVHPWCLFAAITSSSIYVIAIYFGYLRDPAKDPAAIDAGITGLLIQIVLIGLFENLYRLVFKKDTSYGKKEISEESALLYPDRPSWDIPTMSRFGDTALSPELVNKSMAGFYEPMANVYWSALMFLSISLTTPIVAPNEPPLSEDGTGFLFPPQTVHGIPWWAFKIIILSIIPFVILLVAIYKIPGDFPMEDEITIAKKGVDVDLVVLTPQELGRRSSYDEPNDLIHRRRSSIASIMGEMGIQQYKNDSTDEVVVANGVNGSASHKRLSNLVHGRELDKVPEDKDNSNESNKDEEVDM